MPKPPTPARTSNQGCREAISAAERRYGIPTNLLQAIGDVESGRPKFAGGPIEPWPWTVNAQGQGLFFDNRIAATTWVREQQSTGVKSIDIGCMQVNLLQHPDAFRTLEEAFDPATNSDYAGRFLVQLYRASGSWVTAAGFYHSQTTALAADYREHVRLVLRQTLTSRCDAQPDGLLRAWAIGQTNDVTQHSSRLERRRTTPLDLIPPRPLEVVSLSGPSYRVCGSGRIAMTIEMKNDKRPPTVLLPTHAPDTAGRRERAFSMVP